MNVYNIIRVRPGVEANETPPELEDLARFLVESGRLRIDAHEMRNFVMLPLDRFVRFFSRRELFDQKLIPRTISIIGERNHDDLQSRMVLNPIVPLELEMRIARLIVQAAHPAVIMLALTEGIEFFVSYSHNIADLLDLQTYQIHGANSGMQSLGFMESRIFISCDGNPFDTEPENKPAADYSLARFMVIAAQEIAHYSDIKRDDQGMGYTRFSTDFASRRAKPEIAEARLLDIIQVSETSSALHKLGLKEAIALEKQVSFFEKHRKNSYKHLSTNLKSRSTTRGFHNACIEAGYEFAASHSARHLAVMLADMKFNLSPKAPVYSRENKTEEEAIACVEAIARVPQQVIKWGHKTTKFVYPNMYKIYYEEIIPAAVSAYEALTGRKYNMVLTPPAKKTRKF